MAEQSITQPLTGPGTGIKFSKNNRKDFYSTIKKRVDAYFIETNQSRKANGTMIFKTTFILTIFALSYLLVISNWFSPSMMLFLAIVHGFFAALIGLNITHDAMHGAYSDKPKVNHRIGLFFNLIGANDYMWKISHNVLHHTFTNVAEHDADIDQLPLLRMNTKQDLWWIHRFQHIYVFFFYSLTTIAWVFLRDFAEFFHPKVNGAKRTKTPVREFGRMLFYKCIYYSIFVAVPFLVIDLPWQQILLGFVIMHLVEGITLALVFQLAHIVEGTAFPLPDHQGTLEGSWAAHQMQTTADFACENGFANYLFGGLNFQIEHHLFPSICHVHYRALAPIVRKTAYEFGLPYHEHKTYFGALASHVQTLKEFGHGKK